MHRLETVQQPFGRNRSQYIQKQKGETEECLSYCPAILQRPQRPLDVSPSPQQLAEFNWDLQKYTARTPTTEFRLELELENAISLPSTFSQNWKAAECQGDRRLNEWITRANSEISLPPIAGETSETEVKSLMSTGTTDQSVRASQPQHVHQHAQAVGNGSKGDDKAPPRAGKAAESKQAFSSGKRDRKGRNGKEKCPPSGSNREPTD